MQCFPPHEMTPDDYKLIPVNEESRAEEVHRRWDEDLQKKTPFHQRQHLEIYRFDQNLYLGI
jgi:hypothetical protein